MPIVQHRVAHPKTFSKKANEEFALANSVVKVVLWHRKYTQYIPDRVVLNVYIPRYIADGKLIEHVKGETLPPERDLREQFEEWAYYRAQYDQKKKELDEKNRLIQLEQNLHGFKDFCFTAPTSNFLSQTAKELSDSSIN